MHRQGEASESNEAMEKVSPRQAMNSTEDLALWFDFSVDAISRIGASTAAALAAIFWADAKVRTTAAHPSVDRIPLLRENPLLAKQFGSRRQETVPHYESTSQHAQRSRDDAPVPQPPAEQVKNQRRRKRQ